MTEGLQSADLGQNALCIFGQNIKFQIDFVSFNQLPEIRCAARVWDDPDGKGFFAEFGHCEAHSIHAD